MGSYTASLSTEFNQTNSCKWIQLDAIVISYSIVSYCDANLISARSERLLHERRNKKGVHTWLGVGAEGNPKNKSKINK
jgi:hypothetical protein